MPIQTLKNYLDKNKVRYEVVPHLTTYTAQGTAQSAHISGKEIAKTVIVNVDSGDGRMAMVVLPASRKIDLALLKDVTGAQTVELATEDEFKDMFPDCEIGAMPPFGNLYAMDVYVERSLAEDEEIAFNAGNHRELIKMSYRDFERLVKPKVLEIAMSSS